MNYEIIGGAFPVVECHLERNETMITEGGSMVWMSPNMDMQTSGAGGLGRFFSGENIFQNLYTAKNGEGMIAFGSSFPGKIIPVDLREGDWIFQKRAFLASEDSVKVSVEFRKKLGAGFFGGEGFIMQRLSGNGTAFVEIDGDLKEIFLSDGEQIVVDTGNVAGYEAGVSMDIVQVKGMKNILFGGEGLFNTVLTGPGRVWLQTMPISGVASAILPYLPTPSNK
ncbi:MAG: TIGR00266 family protein [Erysipelotrichaceae bacterium]|nr:TIGR00266 family protein [Erysipelotrichaceae bacterium]